MEEFSIIAYHNYIFSVSILLTSRCFSTAKNKRKRRCNYEIDCQKGRENSRYWKTKSRWSTRSKLGKRPGRFRDSVFQLLNTTITLLSFSFFLNCSPNMNSFSRLREWGFLNHILSRHRSIFYSTFFAVFTLFQAILE